MVSFFRLPLIAALLFVCSCGSARRGPEAIGEAFAGPVTLNLREELALRSKVVATVKHGERLEVLQTRRRFVQVRTSQGAMGWTDSRQLMSTDEMRALRLLAEQSKSLPSQGSATVFEILNVHSEPVRSSPSFAQIPEGVKVDLIGHKVVARTAAPRGSTLVATRKAAKAAPKKKKELDSRRIPPPPMPPAPKPPPNWLALSRRAASEDGIDLKTGEDSPDPDAKPAQMEDWSLIRMADSRVGWVLLRMLNMSIPDEVAQYAEGHRITSYFALADIPDEDKVKHAWLWTTNSQRGQPFAFDGFRVFTWNTRRHRYETVYRERGVTGYYPVEVTRVPGDKGVSANFSLLVDGEDGLVKKSYAFNGYRVNLLGRTPYSRPAPGNQATAAVEGSVRAEPSKPASGPWWYTRMRARVRSLFGK